MRVLPMTYNPRTAQSSLQQGAQSLLVSLRDQVILCGLTTILVLLTTTVLGPSLEVAAQEVDPGETNHIVPSERRTLFPDQHGLLAMPQNPNTEEPPVTYTDTDWARSSDLQSLELQEAFVPALQGLEEARAAAGHYHAFWLQTLPVEQNGEGGGSTFVREGPNSPTCSAAPTDRPGNPNGVERFVQVTVDLGACR